MGNWSKVIAILAILSVGVGFGGYMSYKSQYVKPRADIAKKKSELEAQLEQGKALSANMTTSTEGLKRLYNNSFPTNPERAATRYQIWLTQMLDFCDARDPKTTVGQYVLDRRTGLATRRFMAQGEFTLLDLTQFLYEFYWTPFLHRIQTLDIQPQEHSDYLRVSMTIEGLSILYKDRPDRNIPTPDELPLNTPPERRLVSGPFAAYAPLGSMELFRAVKTGVDTASYAKLTGLPVITDDAGVQTVVSRWYLATEDKVTVCKKGERLTVGAFDCFVEDVDPDVGLVVLRQNNGTGRLWSVTLGSNLSDAVAIPSVLY